jgi:hypothetical protein
VPVGAVGGVGAAGEDASIMRSHTVEVTKF